MKLRSYLLFLTLVNGIYGLGFFFSASRTSAALHTIPTLRGPWFNIHGVGYLVVTVVCLSAWVLWSTWWESHVPVDLIRYMRVASQITSLAMTVEWTLTLFLGALFFQLSWLSFGVYIGWIYMQWRSILPSSLTPTREDEVWKSLEEKVD